MRDTIRCAIQIGEALDHAHRHGVLHRDLKPANIMLTKAGVKVLDFGLATLRTAAPVQVPMDHTPRFDAQLTSERGLLGTVHYMAPERLEGREADVASDLFAFGAVMYEMATGRRAFESSSPAGVIADILHTDPPPASSVVPGVPADARLGDSESADENARDPLAGGRRPRRDPPVDGQDACGAGAGRRRGARSWVPVAVAGLALVIAAALSSSRWLRTAPQPPAMMFSIYPPATGGFTPTTSSVQSPQFALSPDGRRVVFVAALEREPSQLWIRELGALDPQPIAGTQGAEYPFWSPDSASVAFFAGGSLKRVDLAGGPPRVLAPAIHGRGGAWNRQGLILYAPTTQDGLFAVAATGGEPRPVTSVGPALGEASHRWPQFLPDDRHFIYFVQKTSQEGHGIYLGDLDQSPPRRLRAAPASAVFAASGHLLFVLDDVLMAASFDWKAGRLEGNRRRSSHRWRRRAASMARSPRRRPDWWCMRVGKALLKWSGWRGTDSARPRRCRRDSTRTSGCRPTTSSWRSRKSIRRRTARHPGARSDARLQAAHHRRCGDRCLADLVARRPASGLPIESPGCPRPVRARVQRHQRERAAVPQRQRQVSDRLDARRGLDRVPHLRERHRLPTSGWLKADGSQASPLLNGPFDEMQGQVAPGGAWIAYTSTETGHPEVYVRSLSDPTLRWQVSAGGGRDPRWRGDAGELFYISADSAVNAVGFTAGRPTAPKRLFPVHVAPPGLPYLSNYDVTRDGQRFLIRVPVHDLSSAPIHVVTDWRALARSLIPDSRRWSPIPQRHVR